MAKRHGMSVTNIKKRDQIIAAVLAGSSIKAAADRFDVRPQTAQTWCSKAGVKSSYQMNKPSEAHHKAVELLESGNMSVTQISETTKLHKSTIWRLAEKHGISKQALIAIGKRNLSANSREQAMRLNASAKRGPGGIGKRSSSDKAFDNAGNFDRPWSRIAEPDDRPRLNASDLARMSVEERRDAIRLTNWRGSSIDPGAR